MQPTCTGASAARTAQGINSPSRKEHAEVVGTVGEGLVWWRTLARQRYRDRRRMHPMVERVGSPICQVLKGTPEDPLSEL